MKSKLLLVLVIVAYFGNMTLKSQTITSDEAKTVAVNFYNQQVTVESSIKLSEISIAHISLMKAKEIGLYYIINIRESGFVIISAQEIVYPVLAYSTKNLFIPTDIPDHVQAFLKGYEKQIIHAVESGLKGDNKIKEAWNSLIKGNRLKISKTGGVEPFTTSLWGQGVPYNNYCPEDPAGPGGHVVTGCPSTAMAQLMYYYRYPEQGVGSNSYYQAPYDTISAEFENAFYDYNAMTNFSNMRNYEEVAELTFHAGVAINTFYGPAVSGVFNMQVVVDGLEDHFAYSEDAELIFKTAYTQTEWENLIIDNLEQSMPVIYCAVDMSAGGGHTWILDGYENDNYFHMNFGWEGAFDGYYYLDDISVGGYTFDEMHQMVINVFPEDPLYPGGCPASKDLIAFDGTFTDGSGPFNYEDNAYCSWLINPQTETDSVLSITLSFDKFDTEPDNDYISIFDVLPEGSMELIATLSGNEIPGSYTSTGNKMLVTFTTNETISSTGWVASYHSNMPEYCNGLMEITDEYGTITDGSGNFHYISNSICMWLIKPSIASSVTVNCLSFETEENNDILKFYDGNVLIGCYSGNNIPPQITAESGEMFIAFTTNGSINFDGWELEYYAGGVNIEETVITDYTFNIFPNPANGIVNIEFNHKTTGITSLEIHNAFGKLMLEYKIDDAEGPVEIEIDCSSFPPGIYMVTVKNELQIITRKVVVN